MSYMTGKEYPSKEHFFSFITERHYMWFDRFILKNSAPWTHDPILQNYKYTNVYRELDRNTVWFLLNIRDAKNIDTHTRVFNTFVYRLINNPQLISDAGGLPTDLSQAVDFLNDLISTELEYKATGNTVFTNAYFIRPSQPKMNKLEGYVKNIFLKVLDNIEQLTEIVMQGTPQEFMEHVTGYTAVGDFIAYELYCDYVHIGSKFGINDFVNTGPGAEQGLMRVYGQCPKGKKTKEDAIKTLKAEFPKFIWDSGYQFAYLNEDLQINLRVIEHSLCEYHKYCTQRDAMNEGSNRSRRMVFKERTSDPNDYLEDYYNKLKIYVVND